MMTFLRAALVVAAIGIAAAHPRAAEQLPTRLDDSTFRQLVMGLSEPGGYFRSDNFISNEGELQYVIPDLRRTVPRGRAYVGVGPEQNFTYIASLEPGIAFIVDIRRQNFIQHLIVKMLMETSPDRATFMSRLMSRPAPAGLDTIAAISGILGALRGVSPDAGMFLRTRGEVRARLEQKYGFTVDTSDNESVRYVLSAFAQAGPDITYSFGQMNFGRGGSFMPTLAQMMTETDADSVPRSYLATDALYQRVREMQQRNLIVPVVGDFAGSQALAAVATWLHAHDATVGVFYASNVEQYLFQQGDDAARFFSNLERFPIDSLSTFVRSVSARGSVPLRNPRSRLAQLTMPIAPMLAAIRAGRVSSYPELVMLRP